LAYSLALIAFTAAVYWGSSGLAGASVRSGPPPPPPPPPPSAPAGRGKTKARSATAMIPERARERSDLAIGGSSPSRTREWASQFPDPRISARPGTRRQSHYIWTCFGIVSSGG